MFNEKPPAGYVDVLFTMAMTYNGSGKSDPFFDMYWEIVGSRGNTFDEWCGSLDDGVINIGDLYAGANAEGDACIQAEADQLDGGTLRIYEILGEEVFVALK